MALYSYHARDLEGVDHKGTMDTSDERQVSKVLMKKGLIVISVKRRSTGNKKLLDKFLNRVSFNSVVVVTRQLATMVESGLVLSEAIDILGEQQSNKKFKEVLEEISRDIKSGMDLATAIKKHPDVFSPLYANLIKAGESSGKLDLTLKQMADSLEKEREFKSRVRGAFIYPAMIMIMMVAVGAIMMFFVIPKLTSLYTQSSIDLPLPTKILIATSTFSTRYWWAVIIMMVVLAILFRKWVKTTSGSYQFDAFLLKFPVIGKVIQGTTLTSFTRTFGLLTSAGIPLLDALTIVANVMGNQVYKRAIEETYKGVERGLPFSTQLDSVRLFPKIVPQMFRVGEETGKVDQISFRLADYFETESDHFVKNLTVIIEPLVLVILGVGVAFLVLSIILPIYKLSTTVT